MCGIAGGIALAPGARVDVARVRRMSSCVAHRGPDAEGLWVSPGGTACLAHRRLSIIDLTGGAQPMVGSGGTVLIFNGEIYNYRELREDLERQGTKCRTNSDTEVLLRLLERDGVECLNALRGMYAFASWHDTHRQFTLARDPIGKKPLYYVVESGCMYFASTLSALVETGVDEYTADPRAVDAFLTLGYIPAPHTIYTNVRKLPAGAVLHGRDGQFHVNQFWNVGETDATFQGTYEQAVDQLDQLLHDAVSLRLRSDVPLGVFLSGGVDSSLVAAVANRQSSVPVQTFSIGFAEHLFNEAPFAARVARYLGTKHREFLLKPELLSLLPEIVRHFGEPYGDSSALPTWMLSQATRQEVTVALGGDGGDEVFGGYAWYRTAAKLERMRRCVPRVAAVAGGRLTRGRVRRGLEMLAIPTASERFAALRSFVNAGEARSLYAGELLQARNSPFEDLVSLRELYEITPGTDLRRMRVVDVMTYLADCLMPKVDVSSMAHGLEVRAPLLDVNIVRFGLGLPDEWVVGPKGGKRILRSVAERYIPGEYFARPKQGFSVPLATWFVGDARSMITNLQHSERLLDTGWFRREGINMLIEEHTRGHRDNSQRMFNLLVLDEWLRQFA